MSDNIKVFLGSGQAFVPSLPRLRALVAIFALVAMMLTAQGVSHPAHANWLGTNCTGPFWGLYQQDVCVLAGLEGKNYAKHTQWLSTVEVSTPSIDPQGCDHSHIQQVWGDGFYHWTYCTAQHWTVNRWVHSGTNVCAASYLVGYFSLREIACVHVRV